MSFGITLRQIFERYKTIRHLKPNTNKDYRTRLNMVKDWLDIPMIIITEEMIIKKHQQLSKSSPSNANGTMRVLRALFNFGCLLYKDEIKENPVEILSGLRAWNKIKRRKVVLKPSQIVTFWSATEHLKRRTTCDYLRTLLLTGLRRNEAAFLKWDDIDLDERVLVVRDTKNGEDHTMPIGSYLYGLLQGRKIGIRGEYVFMGVRAGKPIYPYDKRTINFRNLFGEEFKLHDLRRSFNTYATNLGIHPYTIAALMNHKSTNVTQGYYCPNYEVLRDPIQKIENYILSFVDFEPDTFSISD